MDMHQSVLWSFLFISIAQGALASAESVDNSEVLIDFCKESQHCGYMDINGETVVDPIYQASDPFVNGLAWVRENGLWGAIDKTGKFVIAAKYHSVRKFDDNGYARVSLNQKWGVIGREGQIVIPIEYKDIGNFFDGVAAFQSWDDNLVGLLNDKGEVILSPKYDYIPSIKTVPARVRLNDKWGYIDRMGKEIVQLKYDRAKPFVEGFARVGLLGGRTGLKTKYGFINANGREVIAIKYNWASSNASDNRVSAGLDSGDLFLDTDGREICAKRYDYIGKLTNGLALLRHKGKFGAVDRNCKIIIPAEYHNIYAHKDVVSFKDIHGNVGHIDRTGNELFRIQYDYIDDFHEGFAQFGKNGKYGYLSEKLEEIIPAQYEAGSAFNNGLAIVWKNKKAYYLTKAGLELGPVEVPVRIGKLFTPIYLCEGKRFAINAQGDLLGFQKSEFGKCR